MKKIGMIGSQLIHTYGYGMHLSEFDLDYAREGKTVPKWQFELMEEHPETEPLKDAELTHIWGGLEGVPEDMAGTFDLKVCRSKEEVIEVCDLIMVMDEQIPSRTALARDALETGKPVFTDKLPSDKRDVTEELVNLARDKGVMFTGWSQMGFCPELDRVKQMDQGGTAYVNFRLTPDILDKYGVHLITPVQMCFPGMYRNSKKIATTDEGQIGYIENSLGTKIIFAMGSEFQPAVIRIDYSVGGKSTHVDGADICAAFRRAARQIAGMAQNQKPVLAEEDLLEASHLLSLICSD